MATSGSAGGTYVPNFTDFNKLKVRNEAQNHKNATIIHCMKQEGKRYTRRIASPLQTLAII